MSYNLYRILHLLGIFMLFAAVGGAVLRKIVEGDAGSARPKDRAARLVGITHGVALLLLLVTGFGLLAKLGLGLPGWAWAKLGVWLVMGAIVTLARRSAAAAGAIWWLLPLLGVLAAWLAIFKPF